MKEEMKEFQTFQFLEGLEMQEWKIELPHFTLLHYKEWKQYVLDNSTKEQQEIFSSTLNTINETSIVLNIKLKSNNYQDAMERARVLSEKFEHMMHFIIADLNFIYCVGTKNVRKFELSTVVTFDKTGFGFGNKTHIFHKDYKVHSSLILSKALGYDKLWNLIGKEKLSPLNKRIITSIEWIGKAMWERNYTKSFIQIMIAFEVLLQHQSNSFISSSIANQISEWGAFIYSGKFETRLETYKKIKDLYGLRSKIVHSGFDGVTVDNLYDALNLIKSIIINLVVKEEFLDISIDTLATKINDMKFS